MKRFVLRSYLRCLGAGLSSAVAAAESAFLRLPLEEEAEEVVAAAAVAPLPLTSLPGERAGFMEGDVDVSVRASSLLSSAVGGLWMESCVRLTGGGAGALAGTKFAIQLRTSQSKTLERQG